VTPHRTIGIVAAALLLTPVLIAVDYDDVDLSRFGHLTKTREGGVVATEGKRLASLEAQDPLRLEWGRAAEEHGGAWRVWIDERTSMPTLALVSDLQWHPAHERADLDRLVVLGASFMEKNSAILGDWGEQAVFDRVGSGSLAGDVSLIRFAQIVDGVPVEGARIDFHVARGQLVAFGAERWATVHIDARPLLDADRARTRLIRYVRPSADDGIVETATPELLILPIDADPEDAARWKGARGAGLAHRLVWRLRFNDSIGIATWTGEVDAHTGEIVAFYDDTRYERIKGHINPNSDNGICIDQGCPEPDYPMPYADYSENGGAVQYADYFGHYSCTTPGSIIETTLDGPHFKIVDSCGVVSATTTCDDELDLGVADDTNCAVATGASPGNTDGARSAYYALNLVNRKGRFWVNGNSWLDSTQVECKTNTGGSCNAGWANNSISMFNAAGGCGNTAQIQAVVAHEWGHGFDENDGGDFDNSSEAYADVVAMFESRDSCIGPGFRQTETCPNFGDTCLTCTGVRDQDWDARVLHTPATPSGFVGALCPSGGGPCGGQTHCESFVPAESVFDLATRDLPAMGIDPETAWQLAERLWYQSRPGSSGDIFNCALPSSDSCGVGSWYHQLRVQDDDDGDLTNGTPHAAAIFAAFDRHDIACGLAGDAENQNTTSCPSIGDPDLTFTAQTNAIQLDWNAVGSADFYRVYRNENGCHRGQYPIAEVGSGSTSYLDTEPANGFPVFYRVQAVGSNPACEGPVSDCIEAEAQRLAGRLSLDRSTYACNHLVTLEVTDLNHPSATLSVSVQSDTEGSPETVVLSETSVGSARYIGTIPTTLAPVGADGLLSVNHDDSIVANYVDLDDGEGGVNVMQQVAATADCVGPLISQVHEDDVSDFDARIEWTTDKPAVSKVRFGTSVPPTTMVQGAGISQDSSVWVTGLESCTTYFYEVESTDPAGNTIVDDRNGTYFSFETLIDTGSGAEPCNEGRVTIDVPEAACGVAIPLIVADPGLNGDPATAETVIVGVSSSTESIAEPVILTETGPDTGRFEGSVATQEGMAVSSDGLVQVMHGGTITATYTDMDAGGGLSNLAVDFVSVDCNGPEHPTVMVTGITDKEATIVWTTSEPTTGVVEWGPTPALGNIMPSPSLRTDHAQTIGTFAECGRIYFRIASTDELGYMSTIDLDGVPFAFNAGTVGGVVYRDNFESDAGWSLGSEWEIGAPQGLGSAPGDPSVAFAGSGVLGHDLSGLGAHPGDYEPQATTTATSPVYDLSAVSSVELQFHRWLNILTGTLCQVQAWNGGSWVNVWTCPTTGGLTESDWNFQSLDVTTLAAGNPDFQVRLRNQAVIASSFAAGWNIDQMILRDSTQLPFEGCVDCGGAPAFGGVEGATDDDRCADSGITLSWRPAPAWGTGSSGTYAVYRSTVDDFTPGPGNLIASGIPGTSWTDPAPSADVPLHYIVRAESDETCSAGPNNGGTLDDNLVRVVGTNETGQTLAGPVGDSLRLDTGNRIHALLSWQAGPNAAVHHVYRSNAPGDDFRQVASVPGAEYEDSWTLPDSSDWYYLVVAADACGNEGP